MPFSMQLLETQFLLRVVIDDAGLGFYLRQIQVHRKMVLAALIRCSEPPME